ncbi:MAG: hypothetical protein HY553_00465 [Elusimicrobia bacterium]|nr:hypothetical protein [Elusimicrobiota bacterium]
MAVLNALLASAAFAAAATAPFEFRVRPEPLLLLPGQRLALFVTWRNPAPEGGAPVMINRRGLLGRDVLITVQAKGKPPVPLFVPEDLGPPADRDFQALAPQETLEYEYPVNLKSGGELPPGRYEIRVVYQNDSPGPGAWTGRLEAKAKVLVPKPPRRKTDRKR